MWVSVACAAVLPNGIPTASVARRQFEGRTFDSCASRARQVARIRSSSSDSQRDTALSTAPTAGAAWRRTGRVSPAPTGCGLPSGTLIWGVTGRSGRKSPGVVARLPVSAGERSLGPGGVCNVALGVDAADAGKSGSTIGALA